MTRINSRYIAVFIGLIVLAADLYTKFLVQHHLPVSSSFATYPYGGVAIFHDFLGIEFTLIHAVNRGAAWGMFAEWQHVLLALRFFIIVGILIYAIFFNKKRNCDIPLALILAGASGNVIDYFLYGHVVDMLHFIFWGYDYPVFNLADSAIFIGIAWLLVLSWVDKESNESSSITH
jgi:signal peptidase II